MHFRTLKWAFWLPFLLLLAACSASQVKTGSDTAITSSSTTPISETLTANAKQIGLTSWRTAGYTGKGVTVAVLDTGMPVQDITDRNITLSANLRYDVDTTNDQIVKNNDTSIYNANHGNDMSQIIGSSTYGGAPGVSLLNGVVANSQGEANDVSILKGIQWSVNHHSDIVNLSFGYGALRTYTGASTSNILNEIKAIKNQAVSSKIVIVHSAGNASKSVTSLLTTASGYQDWVKSDAKSNLLIVGATYDNKNLAYFSNYAGSDSDVQARFVVAPAKSEVTDGYQKLYSVGTSGAAANVSGALALMKQRWQSLTGVQLAQIVIDTANRSFTGYSADKFGQGIVDMEAAFSPVGKTSVPVSSVSTASVPLNSAVVSLPAGFESVSASTAFVDSYGRDFTLRYQTPRQTYQSGLDKTVQAYVASPRSYHQQINSVWQLGFTQSGTASHDRQDQNLWFLGMASDYQQHMNRTVLGQVSLTRQMSGMRLGMSATAPNPNLNNVAENESNPRVQGFQGHWGLGGLSLKPYWMGIDNRNAFAGADAQTLSGLQSEYVWKGWLAGLDLSQQIQPGQALVKNYHIDSQRYYVGYRGHLNQKVNVGVLGFWQTDSARIAYQHPQSVGDGSLRYVTDNLRANRRISGVSAALSTQYFQASVLSTNQDQQLFLGFKHSFQ